MERLAERLLEEPVVRSRDRRKSRHLDRFYKKVDFQPGGCWIWLGTVERGYGRVVLWGRRYQAHHITLWLSGRVIPNGYEVDHLCRTRACVNPTHLAVVPPRVNVLTGTGVAAQNARKVTCPAGHSYDKIKKSGERACSRCDKIRDRAYLQTPAGRISRAGIQARAYKRKQALAAKLGVPISRLAEIVSGLR